MSTFRQHFLDFTSTNLICFSFKPDPIQYSSIQGPAPTTVLHSIKATGSRGSAVLQNLALTSTYSDLHVGEEIHDAVTNGRDDHHCHE